MNWETNLAPYAQAIAELKVKLKAMRGQFQSESRHSPIEFITGRIKPVKSILEKAAGKNLDPNNFTGIESELQDIAGLRVVCQFVDDIYTVVDMIRERKDLSIIEERDYIRTHKESGYRSYHLIIEYPVETIHGLKIVIAEIQIRTLAMNFWASNEHSLNYKYKGSIPAHIKERLRKAAEAAYKLDEEMSKIKHEIQEAHQIIDEF
ncbi:GTP pyrophosphokinase family protein [Aciduricibacillus chroicocephali]|uniref:GTP pyrophosphokinase family protein n=1 Tax=Aciduricibacillus chroicocephali TaxID=3054939 RepID=A0ABY9L2I4_9BACI|nr:GTP pyrophosphokinase family protein [Bacillaceae bacterium 44XB]